MVRIRPFAVFALAALTFPVPAVAQTIGVELVPSRAICNYHCTDRGAVVAGGISIGVFARHVFPFDSDEQYGDLFYGYDGPGCAPFTEKIVINLLPPFGPPGNYLILETLTYGRAGTGHRCAGLGLPGDPPIPVGLVTLTSPGLAAFRGSAWVHPAGLENNSVIAISLP